MRKLAKITLKLTRQNGLREGFVMALQALCDRYLIGPAVQVSLQIEYTDAVTQCGKTPAANDNSRRVHVLPR